MGIMHFDGLFLNDELLNCISFVQYDDKIIRILFPGLKDFDLVSKQCLVLNYTENGLSHKTTYSVRATSYEKDLNDFTTKAYFEIKTMVTESIK